MDFLDDMPMVFDLPKVGINNPIRLIELFGGIGTQAMALRDLGADFEHYRLVEFDKYCVNSYNSIHHTNFEPIDIRDVRGKDLGIIDKDKFTYLLTYLLFSMYRFVSCGKNGGYVQKRLGKRRSYTERLIVGS